jgi:hypothetical protein
VQALRRPEAEDRAAVADRAISVGMKLVALPELDRTTRVAKGGYLDPREHRRRSPEALAS